MKAGSLSVRQEPVRVVPDRTQTERTVPTARHHVQSKRNRLLLFVSLALTAGFLLTSLASYFVSRASLREQIVGHELPLTRDSVYSEVQRDLLQPIFLSSLMAHDTFVRDWVVDGEKDPDQMIRYLDEIQQKYGAFTSFFVSERTRLYYQTAGILKQVKETEERDRWYFRVREMKEPYEINVDPDMANDDAMTIFINYRVFDRQGNYIGATGVGLTVYAVRDILARYQKDYGCTVFFTDRQGHIVLRSSNSTLVGDDLADIPGLEEIAAEILAGPQHPLLYHSATEGTVHVNARYVAELGWNLVALQPEGGKVRGIQRALLANLGICAFITTIVLTFINMTLGSYQRRIERMATTDSLTGLHNRQAFDILYSTMAQDCRRRQVECALMLLDIDHFKAVNDTHGHLAGDAILRQVAGVTRSCIRASDILCRWGGEEFIVMLRDCPLADARRIAEEVREAIARVRVLHGGNEVQITVSGGLTPVDPAEDQDCALLRADQSLYRAKANGRNRVEEA